ncbi:hypothetical protein NL676_000299 [Syzygium grande]|nr:hypothetical protein NL676_000299 [Syzygium grande]
MPFALPPPFETPAPSLGFRFRNHPSLEPRHPPEPPVRTRPRRPSTAQISSLGTRRTSLPTYPSLLVKPANGSRRARKDGHTHARSRSRSLFHLALEERSMADHAGDSEPSLMEKMAEKIHGPEFSSSSSSSDSDDDKPPTVGSVKSRVWRLFGREVPVHKVLGGGKPADIFLWRDKKVSAGLLGVATAIWILFELMEYHLITLVCHILILSLAIIFLWANASIFITKSPPNIPEVRLPEKCVLEVASALRFEANRGLALLREIASGRELKKLLSATRAGQVIIRPFNVQLMVYDLKLEFVGHVAVPKTCLALDGLIN